MKEVARCEIGSLEWRIIEAPAEHLQSLAGAEAWGFTDGDSRTIYLNETADADRYRITLLHELFHVAWDVLGLGALTRDGETEEYMCSALAATLGHLLHIRWQTGEVT